MKRIIALLIICCFLLTACSTEQPVAEEPKLATGEQVVIDVESPTACTEEAKVCPDGSVVVRQGPDCEFAACPEADMDLQRTICVDNCGDGICQEMVCQGTNCPCAETRVNCPEDCE